MVKIKYWADHWRDGVMPEYSYTMPWYRARTVRLYLGRFRTR